MINGVWSTSETREVQADGQFVRKESAFRNWVTEDGAPGPTGTGGFKAEAGRYHLYVSLACPWAHRALIYRSVLGLEDAISISVVHPVNMEHGWEFAAYPGATEDHLNQSRYLHEVYSRADPSYSGKVTVPILWDLATGTIVNNKSAEVMRMMGQAFRGMARTWTDYFPEGLREEIDEVNAFVYKHLNNGVYRTGFAASQAAYDTNVANVFGALSTLDGRLSTRRYLLGEKITEADWRLFTTLIRFEPVYYFHFKCNLRPLRSYPNLWRYTRDLLHQPGVRETVNLDHINAHYYLAHRKINPFGLIPIGANIDLDGPDWSAPNEAGEPPMLTLYHYDRSTAAQRVRLLLEEKQLPWSSVIVDTARGDVDQLPDDYHRLNPKGLVPVVVKDEVGIANRSSFSSISKTSIPRPHFDRPGPRTGPPCAFGCIGLTTASTWPAARSAFAS